MNDTALFDDIVEAFDELSEQRNAKCSGLSLQNMDA